LNFQHTLLFIAKNSPVRRRTKGKAKKLEYLAYVTSSKQILNFLAEEYSISTHSVHTEYSGLNYIGTQQYFHLNYYFGQPFNSKRIKNKFH